MFNQQQFLTTGGFVKGAAGAETPTSLPAAPSSLTATEDGEDSIDLAWTNGTTYDTIEIERKTTGSYSLLATIDGGETSYEDTTVSDGTQYTYRVRGIQVKESNYSNEASDTFSIFAPDDITGLSLWLDAESGDLLNDSDAAISDGETVKTWPDQTTNGFDATQGSTLNQPTFRATGGPNSKPAVEFSNESNSKYLTANGAASLFDGDIGNTTTFIVYSFTNTAPPSNDAYAIAAAGHSTGNGLLRLGSLDDNDDKLHIGRRNDAGTLVSKASTSDVVADTPSIFSVVLETTNDKITGRFDGVDEISFFPSGTSTFDRFALGAQVTNSAEFPADAKISEVLIYDSELSTDDHNKVGNYLADKYGITWNTIS